MSVNKLLHLPRNRRNVAHEMKRRYETSGDEEEYSSSQPLPVLNRDVASQIAANTRCADLGRLARTSRMWSDAARPYVVPCQPEGLATSRRQVATRYMVGLIVRALRRTLTLAVATANASNSVINHVATAYGLRRERRSDDGIWYWQPDVVIIPGVALRISFDLTEAQTSALASILVSSSAQMNLLTIGELRESARYAQWLAALDDGYSEAGATLVNILTKWMMTTATFGGTNDRFFQSVLPENGDGWTNETLYAVAPLVAWGTPDERGTSLAEPRVRLNLRSDPDTVQRILNQHVADADVSPLIAYLDTPGTTLTGAQVRGWHTRVLNARWNGITADGGTHTMVELFRVLYANVMPLRYVAWSWLEQNRDASLSTYIDIMERAVGVAPSAWLLDALRAAFGSRGDYYARDALALANLPPSPPPQPASITAWDVSLYAGGASKRR